MTNMTKILPRVFRKKGHPLQLILFITSRCNLACQHCFYAEHLNKPSGELTLEEIQKLSENMDDLLWFSMTGGEPFLRQDIAEIAEIFYQNNHFNVLTIVTNGILQDFTIKSVKEISRKCDKANIIIYVSIDGLEDTHNEIRMTPDGFKKSLSTIYELKKLKKECKNLNIGTVTTICNRNQRELKDLANFLTDKVMPDNITINMLRGKPKSAPLGDIDLKYYYEFIKVQRQKKLDGDLKYFDMFGKQLLWKKEVLQKEIIAKVVRENKYVTPCYAGQISCVMSEKGDLYPCEILDKKFGNIRDVDFDFDKLWYSGKGDDIRKFIKDTNCFCTYECALTTNIIFNMKNLFKMLFVNASRLA